MTTINTQSPLASYLASAGKATPAASGSSQEKPAESTKDPIAELRSLARQMIARSEGGLHHGEFVMVGQQRSGHAGTVQSRTACQNGGHD